MSFENSLFFPHCCLNILCIFIQNIIWCYLYGEINSEKMLLACFCKESLNWPNLCLCPGCPAFHKRLPTGTVLTVVSIFRFFKSKCCFNCINLIFKKLEKNVGKLNSTCIKSSFFFWDHYISNAVDKSVPLKASPFLLTKLFVCCLYIFCNYGHEEWWGLALCIVNFKEQKQNSWFNQSLKKYSYLSECIYFFNLI